MAGLIEKGNIGLRTDQVTGQVTDQVISQVAGQVTSIFKPFTLEWFD